MAKKRTDRLNSLLKEVISDVIRKDVNNPNIPDLLTITQVDISKDLRHAKVFFSVISDDPKVKLQTFQALKDAAGFIATTASKEVVMRYFPSLTFKLDDGVSNQMRVEELLTDIKSEKQTRRVEPHE